MPDAVVIGAGPNGLVAANVLVDAGWSVEVLEAQEEPGGAVRSDRGVHPDYVSDLFSAFYPLAAASPVLARLDLAAEGLRWSHAPSVLAHPLRDGGCAVLERRVADTAAGLAEFAPADGDAWRDMYEVWSRVGPDLVRSLFTPFPPIRAGLRLAARLRAAGGLRLARNLALPVRRLGEEEFAGEGGRLLLAGNALHADLAPEAAGSGGFGWLMSMLGQSHGFPVPVGGSGALTAALVSRFRRRGGVLRCGERVTSVVVRGGRAVGVRTAAGENVGARRAVRRYVRAGPVPGPRGRGTPAGPAAAGPGALPVGLLDLQGRLGADGTRAVDGAASGRRGHAVHVADGIDGLTRFAAQIAMGQVPEEPFALLGQMTTADPSRSPAGTESAWAYTHLPQRVTADAGPDGITGRWDIREQEAMADRLEAQVERFAPGFRARIRARRILAPTTLQAMNENLHNGAINNGTTALHQQAVFRPTPGTGRPETPVRGLYLASAAAHPGGGVHGAPGANAARAALRPHGLHGLLHRAQRV